jgi:hypothetical protein
MPEQIQRGQAISNGFCSDCHSKTGMLTSGLDIGDDFRVPIGSFVSRPDSRRAIESVVGLRCNSSCRRLSRWDIYNALGVITAANVWRPLSETACPFLIGSR